MGKSPASDKENIQIPPGFYLDADLAAAHYLMEHTSECLFITGRAGTGKSSLLNYFRRNTSKKYIVVASTGLASIQVGGSTIHSFFGFPLRTILENDPEIKKWGKGHPKYKIIQNMDTLIIDEVSMVRADLLDAIDQSLRLNLSSDLPFGGKQVILIGDVFQLAPVVNNFNRELSADSYESPYFFSARCYKAATPKIVELTKIYRQQQQDFIYLLNRIRMGHAGKNEINELNKRYSPDDITGEEFAICLTSVNALADKVNQERLRNLNEISFQFRGKSQGIFYDKNFPVEMVLELKKGTQVMMAKNDMAGKWVNGSIGKVLAISDKEIRVEFANGQVHAVDPVTWENRTYKWDQETKSILSENIGSYTQYPIKLAWAVTIHKSQGLTFDKVIIDIGRGAFAHGQLYVALSRCTTWEGIVLKSPVQASDVIVDEIVERFASRYMNS